MYSTTSSITAYRKAPKFNLKNKVKNEQEIKLILNINSKQSRKLDKEKSVDDDEKMRIPKL